MILSTILAAAIAASNPTITYSLPQTVVILDITAKKEEWHAGPYSAYAKELLGIDAVMKDSTAYTLSSVSIHAETEADQTKRFSLKLSDNARPAYLSMTEHGLIAGSDLAVRKINPQKQVLTTPEAPNLGAKVFAAGDIEAEARTAAARIVELRNARYNILIGNTDASYSGDALRAAVEELRRMEDELTVRFTGTYRSGSESSSFEVLPVVDPNNAATIYEAFCLSNIEGIVPAGSIEGLPYYLEIRTEAVEKAQEPEEVVDPNSKKKQPQPALPTQHITYRIPAICLVRLTDGDRTITELRLPVYQLGIEEEYPIYN